MTVGFKEDLVHYQSSPLLIEARAWPGIEALRAWYQELPCLPLWHSRRRVACSREAAAVAAAFSGLCMSMDLGLP